MDTLNTHGYHASFIYNSEDTGTTLTTPQTPYGPHVVNTFSILLTMSLVLNFSEQNVNTLVIAVIFCSYYSDLNLVFAVLFLVFTVIYFQV